MAISTTNRDKLNRMNRAAQNVSLGTLVLGFQTTNDTNGSAISVAQSNINTSASRIAVLETAKITSGSLTAGSQQSNGSAMVLYTGLAAIKGKMVQVSRSGSIITGGSTPLYGTYFSVTGGCITISNINDYAVAVGDQAAFIAW